MWFSHSSLAKIKSFVIQLILCKKRQAVFIFVKQLKILLWIVLKKITGLYNSRGSSLGEIVTNENDSDKYYEHLSTNISSSFFEIITTLRPTAKKGCSTKKSISAEDFAVKPTASTTYYKTNTKATSAAQKKHKITINTSSSWL